MIGKEPGGMIIRRGAISMQVCVPEGWTDEQVLAFAEEENHCGTENGWFIRRKGDPALRGDPERAQCEMNECRVHIILDA